MLNFFLFSFYELTYLQAIQVESGFRSILKTCLMGQYHRNIHPENEMTRDSINEIIPTAESPEKLTHQVFAPALQLHIDSAAEKSSKHSFF